MRSTAPAPAPAQAPARVLCAVVVPFGNFVQDERRNEQLKQFMQHVASLDSRGAEVVVIVAQQTGPTTRFNAGCMRNIGAEWALRVLRARYVVFNDVDLLPDQRLFDAYLSAPPPEGAVHLMPMPIEGYGTRPPLGGGVTSVSAAALRRSNGYPNDFWGWGYEDNEIERRLRLVTPEGAIRLVDQGRLANIDNIRLEGRKYTMLREKDLRNHCARKVMGINAKGAWRRNGLNSVRSRVVSCIETRENIPGKLVKLVNLACELKPPQAYAMNCRLMSAGVRKSS